jgi:hypothetical protein
MNASRNLPRTTNTVIQTYENITVNRTMAAQEFMRKLPAGLAAMSERQMRVDDPRYLDLNTGEFVQAYPPGDLFWSNTESDVQARAGMNLVA